MQQQRNTTIATAHAKTPITIPTIPPGLSPEPPPPVEVEVVVEEEPEVLEEDPPVEDEIAVVEEAEVDMLVVMVEVVFSSSELELELLSKLELELNSEELELELLSKLELELNSDELELGSELELIEASSNTSIGFNLSDDPLTSINNTNTINKLNHK